MSEKAAEHNYRMALMFYRTERYEDAIAILDDLAWSSPTASILYALAKCFAKVGRYQEARALCQELTDKHQDERAQTQSGSVTGTPTFPARFTRRRRITGRYWPS